MFRQVFLGTQHGAAVYLSLIPIVLGVAVATLTEVNIVMIFFNFSGILIDNLIDSVSFSLIAQFCCRCHLTWWG